MQNEIELIFHNADRNTELQRSSFLALQDPPRVRLKDGEHLFVLWDRLALEQTPVALVNLTHSVCEVVLDLIDLPRRCPFCGQLRKNCFNAADTLSAAYKIVLDMHLTGASGFPNLVEPPLDGFLQ